MIKLTDNIFDITQLPLFPYIVGMKGWLLFVILCGFFFLLVQLLPILRQRKQPAKKAFETLIKELSRIENVSLDKELLARISLLLKRFLSICESKELAAMTASELEVVKQKILDQKLKKIIDSIITIDQARFRAVGLDNGNLNVSELLELVIQYNEERKDV